MNTELLLVRHGESNTNVANIFSCRIVDHGLTKLGTEESLSVAHWLRDKQISQVYTSPLRRAKETAEIIASTLGINVAVFDELREVNVGTLEGQSNDHNWKIHNKIVDSWKDGQWDIQFPNGESFSELVQRARNAILHIVRCNPHSAVITHGAMLLAIRYGLCGEDIKIDTPTGSITPISISLRNNYIEFKHKCDPIIDHLVNYKLKL